MNQLPKTPARRSSASGNPAVANWGLNLILVGLVGLILPSFGLSFLKLATLGDAQWIVLGCVVAAGSGAFAWGKRNRPAVAGAVAGGALLLVPIFSYVSFWRHPKAPPPVAQNVRMHRPPPVIPQAKPAPPPPGGLRGRINRLQVEISGDLTADELALVGEFVQDCLPNARFVGSHLASGKSGQAGVATYPVIGVGPVDSAEEFLAQLKFGTVTTISPDRIRIEVKRPLPPAAESVRNRASAALDALRSGDRTRQADAVKSLAKLQPLAQREEVAAELLVLLATPNLGFSTAEAFKRWALPQQAEAIKQLVGQQGVNPVEALDVLGAIDVDAAVQAARDLIATDETLARHVLARLGAPAELSVVAFLQNPDPKIRKIGCEVLQSIGGEASIEPLKSLQSDANATIATEARRAVDIIQNRLQRK
jgi:hypothetical protein